MFGGMIRKRKWILRIVLALVVLFLVLAAFAFLLPQKILCVDTGPVKADVIVILGGGTGSHERPERAAELFKDNDAARIIVSGAGDDEINRGILIASGVPAGAIQLESKSRTTRENAEFTINLLRTESAHRVILVTSWYHSRRALACFKHFGPEIQFYSRPSYFDYAGAAWKQKKIQHRIYLEYLKLAGYWFYYGVCPF
jgi:uncharacterized SAM-binding protein YcdF (DUF218 family)